jgi:hypothetical protein
MPAQPEPARTAMAAVRQLRLGWAEQAARDRAAAAAARLADARRTPPLHLDQPHQRPGAREPTWVAPLPPGPNRCPPTCPYCIPAAAEGG